MVNDTSAAERPWEHIPDTFGGVEDISDTLIAREQEVFLLGDYSGNVAPGNRRGLGLYFRDSRHLSAYALQLDDTWPNVLLTTADTRNTWEQVLGNHRFLQGGNVVGRCTIELHRRRFIRPNGFEEQLVLTNFNPFAVIVRPVFLIGADFADMFEVRGHKRIHSGHHLPPVVRSSSVDYAYLGADNIHRYSHIEFDTQPAMLDESHAAFELTIPAASSQTIQVTVSAGQGTRDRARTRSSKSSVSDPEWQRAFATIETSDETINAVLSTALSDLRMLWTPDSSGRGYLAAGTPWFATLFGRDSLIVALQTLPFMPAVARECLQLLGSYQGTRVDAYSGEEPGKILHEMRQDELSAIAELPYRRYYGSVDSTPLYLLLAAEYFRWSDDRQLLTTLLPSLRSALLWIETFGDVDGDCFLEHGTDSINGLRNQGWKDSTEAIVHADGSLCEGPIALAEVQGYVYMAYSGMAGVFEALGYSDEASRLRAKADALRMQFLQQFWLSEDDFVAMALDRDKRPARVMSSNAGQVLWSGILPTDLANMQSVRLMQSDMFCGWGLRTLSTASPRYNPLGYHVGTVWPHDNAIIAAGLKRSGADDSVEAIFEGLVGAVRTWPDRRLPELFGGHARGHYTRPVPYPVACRPQAWTAGAWFHLLQTLLGFAPDPEVGRLTCVRPRLPEWLREVRIQGIRVGEKTIDLAIRTDVQGTRVDREKGSVQLRIE